ncbi:MAG: cytochrome P460 family protein [Geminicoccaceae bacterium]
MQQLGLRLQVRRVLARSSFVATLLALLIAAPIPLDAQMSSQPEGHFSVDMPAELSAEEAEAIYQRVAPDMADAYAVSQDPGARDYQRWRRFNNAPYTSATHGSRYVNNYGNGLAQGYGRSGADLPLPEGAVLAKDSYAVTDDGDVFLGPLFLMEKMAPGFKPEARDWRYSMIMPDGSFFGMTGGDNEAKVQFCITCHETAGDENDHLFFIPEEFLASD